MSPSHHLRHVLRPVLATTLAVAVVGVGLTGAHAQSGGCTFVAPRGNIYLQFGDLPLLPRGDIVARSFHDPGAATLKNCTATTVVVAFDGATHAMKNLADPHFTLPYELEATVDAANVISVTGVIRANHYVNARGGNYSDFVTLRITP